MNVKHFFRQIQAERIHCHQTYDTRNGKGRQIIPEGTVDPRKVLRERRSKLQPGRKHLHPEYTKNAYNSTMRKQTTSF